MAAQCLISFGSNLGDRHALIAEAARWVARSDLVEDLCTSRLFETPPMGGPSGQEPFLNAVAAFETPASARQILELLQQIETNLGRQRRRRWDARAIDLDVVLHGELVGGGTGLIVPHPRYTARQFVLKPACDVAPHYRDPRFGWSMERLTEHLGQGSASMALVGADVSIREELCRRLESEYGMQTFADRPIGEPMRVLGNAPLPNLPRLGDPLPNAADSNSPANVVENNVVESSDVENSDVENSDVETRTDIRQVDVSNEEPWISAFIPTLPSLASDHTGRREIPRLVARMQSATAETRWPAPHQMWPSGWRWPEYRLEIDDLGWAVSELASALESMRCPVEPVTENGNWW